MAKQMAHMVTIEEVETTDNCTYYFCIPCGRSLGTDTTHYIGDYELAGRIEQVFGDRDDVAAAERAAIRLLKGY